MTKQIVLKTLLYAVAILFLVIFGFPFIFVLLTSFKDQAAYIQNFWNLPSTLYLGNFIAVFKASFLRYLSNSLYVSIISVTLAIFISSMASYVLATMKFKLNKFIFMLFLVGMMIPAHTTLIPIFTLTRELGLLDKTYGLIGPYTSFAIPISVFIMTGFFKEVPKSIQESAHIDGASIFRIYGQIMLPLSLPAISTVAIFNFLSCWNEFIFGLTLINSPDQKTLPIGIREFYGSESVNIPAVLTGVLVASLPVMIFYFLAQEQVIKGLSAGAVKE
ncbi:MAG: carbohydrate ABC transporter permease [Ruminiclostridium sp.]